jgi:hypothetical protein
MEFYGKFMSYNKAFITYVHITQNPYTYVNIISCFENCKINLMKV